MKAFRNIINCTPECKDQNLQFPNEYYSKNKVRLEELDKVRIISQRKWHHHFAYNGDSGAEWKNWFGSDWPKFVSRIYELITWLIKI